MDLETLNERKAALKGQLETVIARANAIMGALEECEFWITRVAGEGTSSPAENGGANDDISGDSGCEGT
jgi:hypothetical protein